MRHLMFGVLLFASACDCRGPNVVRVPECVAETCDGFDNDCDGEIDEDGACVPPTVMCPEVQAVLVGGSVTLAATATEGDGAIVSTDWVLETRPDTSALTVNQSGDSFEFTPDVGGLYVFSYCAVDDRNAKRCCEASVEVGACASPPSPPASTACGTSWDGRPIVQFAPVPDGLRYVLSRQNEPTEIAAAEAGQNWLRPATRVAAGGAIPGTRTSLSLRACRTSDLACCSLPTTVMVDVVETCTTPVAPTRDNVVLSEYVVNGDGACSSSCSNDSCQAGESIEITNLSNCPVALDGFHFAYRNNNASANSYRWMNFGNVDVIPPRGVYVAMRGRQFSQCGAGLPAESTGLYGLRISQLTMEGPNLCSGWFNNSGGGQSELRIAPGEVGDAPNFTPSTAIARIAPYQATMGAACASIGFDAVDSCGTVVGSDVPTTQLRPNQLGRLWHPCDAVASPVPACVRD
ncbi:MAG: hypothetical protein ACO1OB_13240 [Archangium sp.]